MLSEYFGAVVVVDLYVDVVALDVLEQIWLLWRGECLVDVGV